MKPVILDNIPFEIDFDRLLEKLHLKKDNKAVERVKEMVGQAQEIGSPKAMYRQVFIDSRGKDYISAGAIKLESKILRVNLDSVFKFFPYLATCGRELDDWGKSFDDMLDKYWASEIQEMVLRFAIKAVLEHIEENYLPGSSSSMNPGSLVDWSIREQRKLFDLLGDPENEIGIRVTESSLMIPAKSVSGIRYAAENSFENCQVCPRSDCPSRSAPYDKELISEKYS